MTRRVSPAARVLMDAGLTLAQVAARMRMSTAGVSRMLTGSVGADPALIATVRDLAGDDVADRLEDLLPRRRVRRRWSDATTALHRAGGSVTEVAAALGTATKTVSRMLAGEAPPHPDLLDVLTGLVGEEAASEVWSLRGDGRPRVSLPSGWRDLPAGWSAGHSVAACQTCGRPTSVRDPLGYGRHVTCKEKP